MKFINNISDKIWDDFVKKSSQNNIFCKSKYLKTLKVNYEKVGIANNNDELILGNIVFDNNFHFSKVPTLYNGIILSSKIDKPYKVIDAMDYYLDEAVKLYNRIYIRSHYNFEDIRSFSWYNYNKKNKFKINPYYTGVLNLKNINLNKTINSGRLQSIKKAVKKGYSSNIEHDIEILDFLNNETFKKQKIVRGEVASFFAKVVSVNSLENSYGRLMITRNKNSNPVSASLFLYDDGIEYYLAGGTNEEGLENGGASLNIYNQIQNSINQNSSLIDFVGINSPNRGYFKTSFGCKPRLFFELSYQ